MQYELVKYKYGKVKVFTAFCLTPKTEPKVVSAFGKTWTVTNLGASSHQARHFQSPKTAQEFLVKVGQSLEGFDWSLLPDTEPRFS